MGYTCMKITFDLKMSSAKQLLLGIAITASIVFCYSYISQITRSESDHNSAALVCGKVVKSFWASSKRGISAWLIELKDKEKNTIRVIDKKLVSKIKQLDIKRGDYLCIKYIVADYLSNEDFVFQIYRNSEYLLNEKYVMDVYLKKPSRLLAYITLCLLFFSLMLTIKFHR